MNLVTGEIGDDVAQYYLESEQTPAAVGLGVRIAPAGTVEAADINLRIGHKTTHRAVRLCHHCQIARDTREVVLKNNLIKAD